MAARVEANNPGVRNMNQLLKSEALPHRTIEGIKGMRRKQEYKDLVLSLRHESVTEHPQSTPLMGTATLATSPTTPGEGEITHPIRTTNSPELPINDPPTREHLGLIQEELLSLSERLGVSVPQSVSGLYEQLERWCPSVEPRNVTRTNHHTVTALSRRRKRQILFKKVQKSWRLDRARTIRDLLNEKTPGAAAKYPESTLGYWQGLLERPSPSEDRSPDTVRGQLWGLITPVTREEVDSTLASAKGRTAPGPDGRTSVSVRQLGVQKLAWLFNAILYLGEAPEPLTRARTTLIPKVQDPERPEQFRPISMSSVVIRMFHRILARRVARLAPLPTLQKGFAFEEGTASNLLLLQDVIARAKKRHTRLQVCFIDFRKAFDSVGHPAILQAIRRWGFPAELVTYIDKFYSGASTSILGQRVRVTRGVLQGDPLSPLLFNIALDWALSSLPEQVGVEYGGRTLRYLAFADDVVLFSTTPAGMETALAALESSAGKLGLEAGPQKCASLSLLGSKKHKKWVVDQNVQYKIGGVPIQAMGPTSLYRYMGIQVGAGEIGRPTDTLASLIKDLGTLQKSPLKPQQKIWAANSIVASRYRYPLILGKVTNWVTKRMDLEMRKFLRKALHLPGDTPVPFFYASAKDGGLGVYCFTTSIPLLKDAARARLANSTDPLVRHATVEAAPLPTVPTKSLTKKRWAQRLHQSVDGAGLSEAATSPVSSSWVIDGSGLLRGSRCVNAIKIRGNLIHTRLRSTRGRPAAPTRCDKMCNQQESLGHILQRCPSVQPWRIRRHDGVFDLLAKQLGKKGWSTCREPSIQTPAGIRRPDLIVWGRGRSVVIDVQVVADSCATPLLTAHEFKVAYYNWDPITAWVSQKTGAVPSFSSLTLNWRGIMASASVKTLKDLGLTTLDLKLLVVRSLEGSVTIRQAFVAQSGAW